MTRTQSMTVWGLTFLLAAPVLGLTQSIPWALAAAGVVLFVVGAFIGNSDAEVKTERHTKV